MDDVVISNHNTQYNALEQLIRHQCGYMLEITQPSDKKFKITQDLEGTYSMQSNTLTVTCPTNVVSADSKTVTISFDAPTTRADGTPLSSSEIKGYTLTIDGVFPPDITIKAMTCDTSGVCSEWSNPVFEIINP